MLQSESKMADQLKRCVQLENSAKSMHTEIAGLNQDFKNKVTKIGANVVKIANLKEETKARLDQYQTMLTQLHEGFVKNNIVQDESINSMRDVLRTEMKDLKAANMTLEFELARIQQLFRQLQTELLQTMEEKKVQNQEILQTMTAAAEQESKDQEKNGTLNKRSQSLSISHRPSVQSLLPQIKAATQESVTKLTHRQLKVADILKRGQNPSGLSSPVGLRNTGSRRLVQDNSMLTLNSNANTNQLFITGAQGGQSMIDNQIINSGSQVDLKHSFTEAKPRKVFGAEDYLQR